MSNSLSDNAVFLVINMDNGNLIYKSEILIPNTAIELTSLHNYIFNIYPSNNSYIIEKVKTSIEFANLLAVSQKGILWERETEDREKKSGIKSYTGFVFIDSENIFFREEFDYQKCKVLNLRTSSLEKEFNIPVIGDHSGKNYFTDNINTYIIGNIIYYEYNEKEVIITKDEITGKQETSYKTINTFYYEIDANNNYKVSERKKK